MSQEAMDSRRTSLQHDPTTHRTGGSHHHSRRHSEEVRGFSNPDRERQIHSHHYVAPSSQRRKSSHINSSSKTHGIPPKQVVRNNDFCHFPVNIRASARAGVSGSERE